VGNELFAIALKYALAKYSRLKSKTLRHARNAIVQLSQDCGVKEIKLFAHALHDEHAGVRRAAINAISILRETSTAPCIAALLPMLKDKDFDLRGKRLSH